MIVQRPVVVCDGVLTICTIWNHEYIPEESLSFDDLVAALKEGLVSQNSPKHRSIRKTPYKESQVARPTPYKVFSRTHAKSDGEINSDEQYTTTFASPKRRSSLALLSSLSIGKNKPNSVILPLRNEPLKNFEEDEPDDVFVDEEIIRLQERLSDQMNWMRMQGNDCVALETLCSIKEIVIMVRIFLESKTPVALEFKVNHNSTVTVSYQILPDFKNDFMMLKVNNKYCMFMSPF